MAKKKRKKFGAIKLLLLLILFLSALSAVGVYFLAQKNYEVSFLAVDFTPSTEALSNPSQGWYHSYSFSLDEEAFDKTATNAALEEDTDTVLCQLLINLDVYRTAEISQTALDKLQSILAAFSTTNKQILLRFYYEEEPEDLTYVYLHMEQLAPVIEGYSDYIYVMQGVFIGEEAFIFTEASVEESEDASDDASEEDTSEDSEDASDESIDDASDEEVDGLTDEDYADLLAYESSIFNANFYLTAQTSTQYLAGSGEKYLPNELMSFDVDNLASRLSIFTNSISLDLTTKEAAYLKQLCLYVPSGGALDPDGGMEVFTSALEILQSRQISYLSADQAQDILTSWKENIYKGDDAFYGVTQYEYVTAHLGYRYVLQSVETDFNNWSDEDAKIELTLINEGFSAAYERFGFTLIFKNTATEEIFTVALDADNRDWAPGQEATLVWEVPVKTMGKGSYSTYLLVTDNDTGDVISLGNTLESSNNGELIGTLIIN